jgi:hypothetical protein
MMSKFVSVVLPAILIFGAALAGEAAPISFAKKPAVTKDGAGCRIEFAAAAPTDCAVYVLDAQGRTVRHLAAGVLGEKAPEPLKPGLAQQLVWDGTDDAGRPAACGPFKVRVGLGLKPALDKFVGHNPALIGEGEGDYVVSVATGPKGEVFVFHTFGNVHPLDGSLSCVVFSREGKYLRQIMPYPANLPEEKLKGLKRIELENGVRVPFIYQGETRSLVPGAGQNPAHRAIVASDGRVAIVGVQEVARYFHAGLTNVVVINADGSTPPDGVIKTELAKVSGSAASLTLSPDEKTIYAAGLREGDYAGKPTHAVYKFGWTDKNTGVFAGDKAAPGNDETHFNEPMSVATDKDGNVYVADMNNNRVAVLKPDGSFLGALTVDRAQRVEVSRKTGALYVLGGEGGGELQKFASWKEAQPAAKTTIPHNGQRKGQPNPIAIMALDESAEPPVLWITAPGGYYAKPKPIRLLRVEDKGNAFGEGTDVGTAAIKPLGLGASGHLELSVDREREVVYVGKACRFDGRTGVLEALPLAGRDARAFSILAVGLDGFVYLHRGLNDKLTGVHRFDRGLKPAPFPGSDSNVINTPDWSSPDSTRLRGRGLTADLKGNVYVIYQKPFEDNKAFPQDDQQAHALGLYGPDGKVIKERLVDAGIRSINSVRVDYAGNFYLAAGLRPGKDLLPPGLKGKIPESKKDPDAACGLNFYPMMYGSIVKFGPEGGTIRRNIGGVDCNYAFGTPTQVKGAKWIYSGACVVPSWRTEGTPDICLCESPRFDVDGFGRSFYPDAGRFRVGVLDTAGNQIGTFGAYGNQDSAGPKSAVAVPEIPFQWVQAVAVGDEAAYVGDRLNRRVVRVKLGYAAEETVAAP